MRKMLVTLKAEFNIPPGVIIHDNGFFEVEGVMFTPTLSFDCVEMDGDDILNFPNDTFSVKEYLIENNYVESEVEEYED